MVNNSSFKVSQDLEVMSPKTDKAYIIPKREWDFLKKKVSKISSSVNGWYISGATVFGLSGTAWLNLFFMDFPKNTDSSSVNKFTICVSFAICTVIVGTLLLLFGYTKRNDQKATVADVSEEMEKIEERYPSTKGE